MNFIVGFNKKYLNEFINPKFKRLLIEFKLMG